MLFLKMSQPFRIGRSLAIKQSKVAVNIILTLQVGKKDYNALTQFYAFNCQKARGDKQRFK